MKASASAAGPQLPVTEPKASAAAAAAAGQARAPVARAEGMVEDHDEAMRRAIAKRALRPVQAKAAVDFGYGDLIAAARAGRLQAKLTIGRTDDPLEAEADRVAAAVTGMPEPAAPRIARECSTCEADQERSIQRSPSDESEDDKDLPAPEDAIAAGQGGGDDEPSEETSVQTKQTGGPAPSKAPSVEAELAAGKGGGQPFSEAHRGFFESRFGYDFSQVKIHTEAAADALSRDLNARAFTTGHDIYFRQGEYSPESPSGRNLLAHELTHVVQQRGGSLARKVDIQAAGDGPRIQRKNGNKKSQEYNEHSVFVPATYTTLDQMYRLFERTAYGREVNHQWSCGDYCDMKQNQGKIVPFLAHRSAVERYTDPAAEERRQKHKKEYGGLGNQKKKAIGDEVDKRYYKSSGDKPGSKIKKGERGKSRQWEQKLDEVMQEKEVLEKLPPGIKALMTGKAAEFEPKDYPQLLRIAEKLKQFGSEDIAVYKLLAIRATDNLDLFEKSVDMFLARKEELKKALAAQQTAQQKGDQQEPTLEDAIAEKWEGLDEAALGKMSEAERYAFAQQKANEITAAQLKYMKDHPGATLADFAKSATLLNSPETFSAIGKDITEAANGDANAWARWAAGVGAGAKISGWLLAVAGVLYVASWLTGIGELATIAAAAGYLLGSMLVLSAAEHDLRVKAASQAKTPEEFKHNVEAAAAAQTNIVVATALIVVAAVLHFTAKALFPKTLQSIKTSLKNFREKVRLKGSIYKLKPQIASELGARKAELLKSSELAKQKALESAKELEGASTEQFVDKLEKGDGGFLDQSKVPPEQKVDFRELLKSPEGKKAIEGYKQRLIDVLKTDVIAEIDRLTGEYASKIDDFLKDVEAAKNHDDLAAATDKLEAALSDEHAKKFMQGEQDALTQRKLKEALDQIADDAAKAKAEAEKKAAGQTKPPEKGSEGEPPIKKEEPEQKPPAVPDDAYASFGKKHGLSGATVDRLRANRIDLDRAQQLINGDKWNKGKSPEVAADYAVREKAIAAEIEKQGIAKGKAAQEAARLASNVGAVDQIERLLRAGKLYNNPKNLPDFLKALGKGGIEHFQALDDAISRIEKGHKVDLEGDADVVDHTTSEAIQHKKMLKGTSDQSLGENIQKAISQLAGETGETPPTGYKRIADVRIANEKNPYYQADGAALEKYLKDMKKLADEGVDPNARLPKITPDLRVKITNAKGTFTFDGPDFNLVP